MTQRPHCSLENDPIQIALEQGLEGIAQVFTTILNEAMKIERSNHLNATPYERSDNRQGYANGFKPRKINTRVGKMELNIPQVRGDDKKFYPSALEKGQRSERALKVAIAEMYIKGVSTRKVTKVMEKLCGLEVTSSQVSRATQELDTQLENWRNRPLGKISYLILDARYEKVRRDAKVCSAAVLIATGVFPDGHRAILGADVAINEAEVHWRTFLKSLKERGMHGVEYVVSDDHDGIKAALKASLPGVPWQRCQVHLQRNAASYVPKKEMRSEVAADLRNIFNAPNKEEAERLLAIAVNKYEKKASKLAAWMEENIPEGFTVFSLPDSHRLRMKTSNSIENLNRNIKRRTRVVGLFPNEDALLRLVSAITMEISEEWETGNRYLNFDKK